MSETKNDALAIKLSLNKETLRVIDDSQLEILDEVVGGRLSECNGSCVETGCQGTGLRDDHDQQK